MRKIVVNMNLSLDGVMQAPGRLDEDTRGGFQHGGWAAPYFDPFMAEHAAAGIAQAPALLFGRRTYEDFYAVWPDQSDNMFTQVLNNARKYVASTTLTEPLLWENTTLLRGDVPQAVARLKDTLDRDIAILGSGALVRSLMQHNLVDEYVLSIHPLVLGSGQRLFTKGSPLAALELVDSKTSTTGVVIATYRTKPASAGNVG